MGRAITLVPTESHEAGRLLSRYGGVIGTDGDYEGAQEALGRAITIARREGDVPLEMQTLAYAALVSAQHLRWQESLDNGLRAIELAPGDENPVSEVLSRYWTAASLLRMGHPNAARPHTLVLLDLAERRSTPRLLASNCFVQITFQSCLEGDWKAGREHSDRGLELSPVNPQLLLHRVLLEHETGESAQGEVYLERLLEVMRRGGPDQFLASGRASIAVTAVARITGIPTRLEIAEAALSEPIITPIFALSARAALALLAVQKDDLSAAAEHYTHVRGRQGMMILTVSSVDRLLGLLSQTMGNIDQATGHFEDALGFCRKAGYRPELAWTCCDYADMLRERGGPGDAETAVALLDECLAISSELGMRPLMERVLSRRENLDTESSDDSKSLAMAEEESAITTPTISGPKPNESVAQDAFSLIRDMDSISLSRFNVVPGYSKYDERTRNLLKDARQRIVEGLQHPGQKRENHLLWAAPGSGKTYFVQRVSSTLPDTVAYHEINLARFGQQEFVDALGRLDNATGPCLCLVDEIDAKPEDVWPYEVLLPYLDAGVVRGAPYIFVMAGSSGSGIDEMKRHIAIRPKGADLLSRVPAINECQIPSLGTGDRLLMAMSQFRQKGREAGKDVQSVEKLGLYYVALNPLLGNARQLREFVVRAVQRMPAGEDRIKYDHLFSAGDPENKAFWSEAVSIAGDLENRYVAVED
ncbi:MAG: tetratricopeptide repeat protein [Chloroflexi bacterium]|nr:tetratricopeptide repeat protein [Chloroflexota bacterium]